MALNPSEPKVRKGQAFRLCFSKVMPRSIKKTCLFATCVKLRRAYRNQFDGAALCVPPGRLALRAKFAEEFPCEHGTSFRQKCEPVFVHKRTKARFDEGECRQNERAPYWVLFHFGGATRNRTGDRGVADLCLTAWPWRHIFCQQTDYITKILDCQGFFYTFYLYLLGLSVSPKR